MCWRQAQVQFTVVWCYSVRGWGQALKLASDMRLACAQEGDSVIIDVDADGQVSVLNGDKKMTTALDATPAGIS